jgi:hypothetical protein
MLTEKDKQQLEMCAAYLLSKLDDCKMAMDSEVLEYINQTVNDDSSLRGSRNPMR